MLTGAGAIVTTTTGGMGATGAAMLEKEVVFPLHTKAKAGDRAHGRKRTRTQASANDARVKFAARAMRNADELLWNVC